MITETQAKDDVIFARLGRALDQADQPQFEVTVPTTPWRYVVGIAVSFAMAVSLLAGATSYYAAAYAVNHTNETVADAVADRNRRIAGQQAVMDEYRRHQCTVIGSVPRPWQPELQRLHDEVLRCADLSGVPAPLPIPSVTR